MTVSQIFEEGGSWMIPLALLGVALVPTTVVWVALGATSRRDRARLYATVLLVAGLAPPMLGAMTKALVLREVEAALASANPSDRPAIRLMSIGESMGLLLVGWAGAIVPIFGGFTLLGLGLSRGLEENRP